MRGQRIDPERCALPRPLRRRACCSVRLPAHSNSIRPATARGNPPASCTYRSALPRARSARRVAGSPHTLCLSRCAVPRARQSRRACCDVRYPARITHVMHVAMRGPAHVAQGATHPTVMNQSVVESLADALTRARCELTQLRGAPPIRCSKHRRHIDRLERSWNSQRLAGSPLRGSLSSGATCFARAFLARHVEQLR